MKRKKMKRGIAAACLLSAAMIVHTIPVQAEPEGARIYLKAGEYSEKERTLDVSCMLENGKHITNGKLRIYYDKEKAKLTDSGAGEALDGAMTEINDCVSGNKEEGELVCVFASAQDIAEKGSLLDMDLQLGEGVKEGDKIGFEIKAEKIAGDSGDVEVQVEEAVYVVGEGMQEAGNGAEEDKEPDKDKSDTGNSGSSGSKGTSSRTKGKVKTGDENRIAFYALGCAAGLAAAGGALWTHKNKRKSK